MRGFVDGTHVPVNRLALRQTLGGIHYEPEKKAKHSHVEELPEVVKFPGCPDKDLTGVRISKVTVIGYVGRHRSEKQSRWLVRCVCGQFYTLRSQVIRKYKGKDLHCANCEKLRQLKAREYYKVHGYYP